MIRQSQTQLQEDDLTFITGSPPTPVEAEKEEDIQ